MTPCPFCGSQELANRVGDDLDRIECLHCHATAPVVVWPLRTRQIRASGDLQGHRPGPWIAEYSEGWRVVEASGDVVAMTMPGTDSQAKANALLIAQAPALAVEVEALRHDIARQMDIAAEAVNERDALLEVLEAISSDHGLGFNDSAAYWAAYVADLIDAAREAIAKVRGGEG